MFKSLIFRISSIVQPYLSRFKIKKLNNIIFMLQSSKILYFFNKFIYYDKDYFLYQYSKDIYEYLLEKNIDIMSSFKYLDQKSQDIVCTFLKRIHYIYNNSTLRRSELYSIDDLKKEKSIHLYLNECRKNFYLPIDKYNPEIFYNKCGLRFLDKNVINYLEGKDFIDGGAFIGDSALVFEKFYNPNKIYAFEPELNNFENMQKTIEKNHLIKVIPINKGLSDNPQKARILSQSSTSHISELGDQEIQMDSIDNFVITNNLKIGLIKLDVEGIELDVLKGAKKIIQKDKPVLLISIYHNGEEFFEMIKYVKKLYSDYKCIVRRIDPLTPIYDTILISWPEKLC